MTKLETGGKVEKRKVEPITQATLPQSDRVQAGKDKTHGGSRLTRCKKVGSRREKKREE